MFLKAVAPKSKRGEPAWDVALLYPPQGQWSDDDFLAIEGGVNRPKELVNGRFQVLPWATLSHQRLVIHLLDEMTSYLNFSKLGGKLLPGPLPVLLRPGTIREPDLVYLCPQRYRRTKEYPRGADLVVEVVSGTVEDRRRDLVQKRKDYARAQISEYWVVDAQKECVRVLTLNRTNKRYDVHGTFKAGDKATSNYFRGFTVDVTDLFTHASRS